MLSTVRPYGFSSIFQMNMADVLHIMTEDIEIVRMHEGGVEQLFELNVLTEGKAAPSPLMMHLVVAEMLLEMSLHVTELLEQVVKVLEQIVEVEALRLEATVALEVVVAHLVVLSSFFRVSQYFVGLGDLTELLLSTLLRTLIRMVFQRQFSESFLDLLVSGALLQPKGLIVVFGLVAKHVCDAQSRA